MFVFMTKYFNVFLLHFNLCPGRKSAWSEESKRQKPRIPRSVEKPLL